MKQGDASTRTLRGSERTGGLEGLRVVLERSGIDEERFASVAAAAIDALKRRAVDDPATQLSASERTALLAGGLDLRPRHPREPDPASDAAARYAALLADSAGVAEVAGILGVTPARVRQRAAEGTLFAIREGESWRFPRAQFAGNEQIRGLASVCAALPDDLHPSSAWRFLTEPDPDLELDGHPVSPMAWLHSGGATQPVVDIAREL